MLTLGFRRTHRSPHGVVQAPQLALGAAVHIAHANHDGMRLIVQIQAVGNQLLQFDLGEPFKRSSTAATWPAFVSTLMPGAAALATGAFTPTTGTAIVATRTTTLRTITAWRTIPARFAAMAVLSD